MKVYIVISDVGYIWGVFSTRDMAEEITMKGDRVIEAEIDQ